MTRVKYLFARGRNPEKTQKNSASVKSKSIGARVIENYWKNKKKKKKKKNLETGTDGAAPMCLWCPAALKIC